MAGFVVQRWDLEPYPGDQSPAHIHHESDEAFGVVSGRLEVLVGTERRILEAGDLVVVPAGTPHTFATVDDHPVRMYCVMTPEIDALITALHAAEDDDERAAAWLSHRSTVV